ncbi:MULTISPECIES: hypothetical protein [unclassified Tychonema]|nr:MULTISPECIES: hypothetical protein [unclassified Tychonema]
MPLLRRSTIRHGKLLPQLTVSVLILAPIARAAPGAAPVVFPVC